MIPPGTVVLVTGGSGFIGCNLVAYLGHQECRVRSLDIRPLPDDMQDSNEVLHVTGDITDPETLKRAVDGAGVVFHLAGLVTQKGASRADYRRVNVEATRTLLETCERAGVRQFIYCSSDSVSGPIRRPPARESDPCFPDNIYGITKYAAESEVLQFAGAMHVTIVRPTRTYGPWDVRMLEIFRRIQKKTFYMVGAGDVLFHPVYIGDLMDGFARCAEMRTGSGEIFYLGGASPLRLKDFLNIVAEYLHVRLPRFRVPLFPALVGAFFIEKGCSLLGMAPPVTRRNLEFFSRHRAYDISKAKAMLGFSPRVNPEEGVRRTGDWYRERGYI
ncbi:MAG: NAD-dependent epimerase/dehydratase family protein [Deltaproteobacteria bacterium]|nr:NAD-dependent epimerase/dehydratase family protein [Deltaproteobacteria bacterium]MBW2132870.1 NAD-dependent epimerase/dehydratase family protein [Deltaproteobacteria bacterium]